MNKNAQKARAAHRAVKEVRDGMTVGLGTGSTAAFVIDEIGKRVRSGMQILGIPTSLATERLANMAGIRTCDLSDLAAIDLAIDGIDAIDPRFRAIKGRGGAMLREKLVATAALRTIVVGDASKSVETLASTALPVEVLPFARALVANALTAMGAYPKLRRQDDGRPWLTDQNNFVVDCDISECRNLAVLDVTISTIPGVLGHGLFLREIDALYLGLPDGKVAYREKPEGNNDGLGRV